MADSWTAYAARPLTFEISILVSCFQYIIGISRGAWIRKELVVTVEAVELLVSR
jgi:hypothetical protein